MDELLAILNSPLTIVGLIGIYIALLRMGFPVDKALVVLFKGKDSNTEKHAEDENGIKALVEQVLASQEGLQTHFNHETTVLLEQIRNDLKDHNELDRASLSLLKEFKEYGIPCRKERP